MEVVGLRIRDVAPRRCAPPATCEAELLVELLAPLAGEMENGAEIELVALFDRIAALIGETPQPAVRL